MKLPALSLLFLALASTSLLAADPAGTYRFKDPSKPGSLKLILARGDVHITPSKEPGLITVSGAKLQEKKEKREDGLRELGAASPSLVLNDEGNAAEINLSSKGLFSGEETDLDITVPKDTRLEIENAWGGNIKVEGISGDTSIQGLNCDVDLLECSGGTNVETMSGDITAVYNSVAEGKPVSLSSLNGSISVKVPADTKAQVRFRTHSGAILTDFPEDALKISTENLTGESWGAVAGQHAALAAKVASEVGREVAQMAREIALETRDAVREARRAKEGTEAAAPEARPAHPPRPPRKPSIPAVSGGRVVSGTLNGGGTPIQITSMSGDITFRKN